MSSNLRNYSYSTPPIGVTHSRRVTLPNTLQQQKYVSFKISDKAYVYILQLQAVLQEAQVSHIIRRKMTTKVAGRVIGLEEEDAKEMIPQCCELCCIMSRHS